MSLEKYYGNILLKKIHWNDKSTSNSTILIKWMLIRWFFIQIDKDFKNFIVTPCQSPYNRGYKVVHTGDVKFEERKRRFVDLISLYKSKEIKVFKFVCTLYYTENSDFTRFTPRNSVQKCMNISRIFDSTMSACGWNITIF